MFELEVLLVEEDHAHCEQTIDDAARCLKLVLDNCTWPIGSHREIRAFSRIARWSARLGLQDLVFPVYQRLLQLTEAAGDQTLYIQSLEELGDLYRKQGDFARASELQRQAADRARAECHPELEAHACNNLGVIEVELGHLTEAEILLSQALELLESSPEPLLEGHVYNNLGVIQCIKGQPEKGCIEFNRALLYRDMARDRIGFAETLHNLGLTCTELNRWDEADDYLEKALMIARELGHNQSIGNIQLARSELALKREQIIISHKLAEEASQCYRRVNDPLGTADALKLQGEAAIRANRPDEAERLLEEALQLNEKFHHRLGLAQCREILFRICLMNNDHLKSELHRKAAIELWTHLGNDTAVFRLSDSKSPD